MSRDRKAMQPKTDTDAVGAAIREFEAALPGWWWSICVCSVSRDASCAPDIAGPDADLLQERTFDEGLPQRHTGKFAAERHGAST
jgi:hypothetical protein